jgi:Ca-activated chloride channel family protein
MLWLMLIAETLLIAFLWWAWRRRLFLISQFVQSRLLAQLTVGVSPRRQKLRMALLVLGVACLFLALAQPQWGFELEQVRQKGLDIVVAVDTSRSMLAEDLKPNRLERAKLEALDLLRQARSDRLGLVAFAGTAFLQCPLTLDDEAFRQSVNALEVGIIPEGGTALAEAIRTALTAFKADSENVKVLVLFTDGEDHEGGAVAAAREAAEQGMRIFAVGVGTTEGDLLRQRDAQGRLTIIKDEHGTDVRSQLNELLLNQIATAAKGLYLPLRGAKTIQVLYDKCLAPLPKAERASQPLKLYHERYQWPLSLAILLLIAEIFIPDRKRVIRTEKMLDAGNTELKKAVAAFVLLTLPAVLAGSPASARRDYEKGDFLGALRQYEQLKKQRPDDPRIDFNAGAAAYRAQRYGQAITNFSGALVSPEADRQLQEHAYYNLGNAFYRAGEEAHEVQQKLQAWEQSAQQFERALALDPQDADARHNLEFVRKKLEELKQQQTQQQQQSQSGQDGREKDKSDAQDRRNRDELEQEQSRAQSNQEQQPEPKPADQEQGQKQDAASRQQGADENQEAAHEPIRQPEGNRGETDETSSTEGGTPLGQMTQEQARQLLDSQKSEEKALMLRPPEHRRVIDRTRKDW